jgi:disulfide bond formation protein DsbB
MGGVTDMIGSLSRRPAALIALAGLGSAGLLAGAFAFQHLGGMAPCEMCIWQRWPHAAGAGLAALALAVPAARRVAGGAAAGAMALGAAIALLHAGVELDWWEGVTECAGAVGGGMSGQDLLDAILAAPVVRCDQVPWAMLGLSMAGWNGVVSLGLLGLWVRALVQGSSGASQ